VIIPDVNLLLYAHVTAFPEHTRARRWWESLMNGRREVGVAAPALFGFVRLASNPRVLDRPVPAAGTSRVARRPNVHFL
jgi:predicted nucleic acid-binding protein